MKGGGSLDAKVFDHTKLMLVDELWTLLGSANWDPRSLRLNFEFNVECYDRELATSLTALVRSKIHQSRPLSLADVDERSLAIKLRDGVARLFSPYLWPRSVHVYLDFGGIDIQRLSPAPSH